MPRSKRVNEPANFQFQQRSYAKHSVSIKTSGRTQNMEVRMPSHEITESVYDDYRPWDRVFFRHGFLEEFFQGFPRTTAELREQFSIIEEIPAQNFGYTEDKMTAWNLFEDFFTKPFTTSDPCETIMQDAAIQVVEGGGIK
jgi:hypothetical protein